MVTDNRPRFKATFKAKADELTKTAAEHTADMARQNAPEDTGELKESIEAVAGEGGKQRVVVGAEHGPAIEQGTADTIAQPFLHPAFQMGAAKLKNDARHITPE